jgi:phage-related minor tail protein
MEEAADAIKGVWQNGLVPEDALDSEIESVGAKLSTLSMIAGDETDKVAASVKQMLRNGLAKNATEAMDLMVRGVQQGVNKSGDLFDTFNEYGTQFRKLGLDGAESMGLMQQALRGGARDADTAADALKEFSIKAIDGSKGAIDGYKALGLNADKMIAQIAKGGPAAKAGLDVVLDRLRAMKDPVKQNAAAVGLFGTKAEDLGAALFDMDVTGAAGELGEFAGAADKAGQTLEQSAGAKLESFKRKALGELTEQLAKMIPTIEKTFGWLQKNSSWVQPLAVGLGILAAAIGIATAVQWAWNAALMVSPVTWIILAIVALIAIIVLVATKTKFFQTIWEYVWGFLKKVGAWFAGPFAGFFVAAWQKIWGFLKAVGAWFAGPFAGFFVMLWNKIKAFAAGVWNAVKMYFGFWYGLFNKVKGWAVAAFQAISNKVSAFVRWIGGIPGKVSSKLSTMWNGLKSGFKSAINWVIGKWNSIRFSIPSFSILGKNFGGGSIGVPRIPMLAKGGIVKASPGGTLVNVGEGGQDEAVVPLNRAPEFRGSGAGDRPIVIEFHGNETDFRRWMAKSFRVKGVPGSSAFRGATA